METETKDPKTKVKELTTNLDLVAMSTNEYLGIRNRFFSIFKRDVFDSRFTLDEQIIISGKLNAHAGDVLADAQLYEKGIRKDLQPFQFL
jgi:hypothetical protein